MAQPSTMSEDITKWMENIMEVKLRRKSPISNMTLLVGESSADRITRPNTRTPISTALGVPGMPDMAAYSG